MKLVALTPGVGAIACKRCIESTCHTLAVVVLLLCNRGLQVDRSLKDEFPMQHIRIRRVTMRYLYICATVANAKALLPFGAVTASSSGAACVLRAVLFGACKLATDTSVWPTAALYALLLLAYMCRHGTALAAESSVGGVVYRPYAAMYTHKTVQSAHSSINHRNSAAVLVCSTSYKGGSIRTLTMSHARQRSAAAAAAAATAAAAIGRSVLSCAAVLVAAALCDSYCLAQTALSTAAAH
eukprot:3432-Heterococcus_DN1.PRE.1